MRIRGFRTHHPVSSRLFPMTSWEEKEEISCLRGVAIMSLGTGISKVIYPGACEGPIRLVEKSKDLPTGIEGLLGGDSKSGEKFIFLCDSPKMGLSLLVPIALGFIFRGGSNLSHFANNLRYFQIPSCIDPELWETARKDCEGGKAGRRFEFCSGIPPRYSSRTKRDFQIRLDSYHRKLREIPIELPVFDVQKRPHSELDRLVADRIGDKALSINALRSEKCLIPETLIISNIPFDGEMQMTIDSILAAVERTFPEFGHGPESSLMIRASPPNHGKSRKSMVGLLPTSCIRAPLECREVIGRHLRKWGSIQPAGEKATLNEVVQKCIPAVFLGVLFTRLPWDYGSKTIVLDLTGGPGNKSPGLHQLKIENSEDLTDAKREGYFCERLSSDLAGLLPSFLQTDLFYRAFSKFLSRCVGLQDKFGVPLDIEFVITGNFVIHFMQFRHIHFM